MLKSGSKGHHLMLLKRKPGTDSDGRRGGVLPAVAQSEQADLVVIWMHSEGSPGTPPRHRVRDHSRIAASGSQRVRGAPECFTCGRGHRIAYDHSNGIGNGSGRAPIISISSPFFHEMLPAAKLRDAPMKTT